MNGVIIVGREPSQKESPQTVGPNDQWMYYFVCNECFVIVDITSTVLNITVC